MSWFGPPGRRRRAARAIRRYWSGNRLPVSYIDAQPFDGAFDLLADPLSPQVRAAVFRMLATLPGVTAAGKVRDVLGRLGYGITLTGLRWPPSWHVPLSDINSSKMVLVIDPANGMPLEHEDQGIPAVISPGPPRGHTIEALISQGWTNDAPIPKG